MPLFYHIKPLHVFSVQVVLVCGVLLCSMSLFVVDFYFFFLAVALISPDCFRTVIMCLSLRP